MNTKTRLLGLALCMILGASMQAFSQERPTFLTVTTIHWNMDYADFSMEEWKKVEKEYFDKVTMKNEYIMTSLVLMHYFTEDNSELVLVNGYSSWENIEKAQERTAELEKEGWPDEAAREAFFKKQGAYYANMHSDEIYSTLEGAMMLKEKPTKPMIYYLRISHRAFPEDGKPEEIQALRKEYFDHVISKNTYLKAYYPSRHAWGSDGRDFIEAFVFESLADLEKSAEENRKLVSEHWPDETARDAFFDKMEKYYTGFHSDYLYRHVPELRK